MVNSGAIETFLTLLVFYPGQGFNPAWIALPDNSNVSKWVLAKSTKTVAVEQVTEELSKLKERVGQTIDECGRSYLSS